MKNHMDNVLLNSHVNNYLSSKHICNNAIQLKNRNFICNLNVLFFTKHKDEVIIIFWILTIKVGKLFKIKFHKKKNRQTKGIGFLNQTSFIVASIYTKFTFSALRLLPYFFDIVPFEKHRRMKEFKSKLNKSKITHLYSNIRRCLWINDGGIFWSYVGIINEYDIIYLMRNLDFGEIPTVKVLFKYRATFGNYKESSAGYNIKNSLITMLA